MWKITLNKRELDLLCEAIGAFKQVASDNERSDEYDEWSNLLVRFETVTLIVGCHHTKDGTFCDECHDLHLRLAALEKHK